MCLLLNYAWGPHASPPIIRHDVSLEISVSLTFLAQLISWWVQQQLKIESRNASHCGHCTDVDRRAQGLSYAYILIVYKANYRWIHFKGLIHKVRALFNYLMIDLLLQNFSHWGLGWLSHFFMGMGWKISALVIVSTTVSHFYPTELPAWLFFI